MSAQPLPSEVDRWLAATAEAGAVIVALLEERTRLYAALADANGHRKDTTTNVT